MKKYFISYFRKFPKGLYILILLTFAIYLQSVFNGFTNWDDTSQITENKDITSISLQNIKIIFSSFYVGMYQPLTTLFYSIIHAFAGMKPFMFHLFQILLHAINIFLVYLFFKKINNNEKIALFTAALFALSPVQTEAVAWVSATSTLLFTFFMLLSALSYMYYRASFQKHKYFFALIFFIFSLLSKTAAVILPLLLILIDMHFDRKLIQKQLLNKIPFLILSIITGVVAIYARKQSGHLINISQYYSAFNSILFPIYSLSFYIVSPILPLKLSAFHPYPHVVNGILPLYLYFSPLFIILVSSLVIRIKRENPQYFFGAAFFLINIVIMLDLIPVGVQIVKERYTYLASAGLFFIIGLFIHDLQLKKSKFKRLLLIAGIVFTLCFSFITSQRIYTWKNSLTLWDDVLKKYPDASAALINRGNAYATIQNYNKAVDDYSAAITFEPGAADAYANRALVYNSLQEFDKALMDYDKAISISPANYGFYEERADVKFRSNNIHGAVEDISYVISLMPDEEKYYNKRGIMFGMLGLVNEARSDFNKAISLNADYADAYSNRGLLNLNNKNYSEAIRDLTEAIRINPKSAKTYYIRGLAYNTTGKAEKACNDFKSAYELGMNEASLMIQEVCK